MWGTFPTCPPECGTHSANVAGLSESGESTLDQGDQPFTRKIRSPRLRLLLDVACYAQDRHVGNVPHIHAAPSMFTAYSQQWGEAAAEPLQPVSVLPGASQQALRPPDNLRRGSGDPKVKCRAIW